MCMTLCCSCCSCLFTKCFQRLFILAFNLLLIAFGGATLGLGLWSRARNDDIADLLPDFAVTTAIIVGAFLLITGLMGIIFLCNARKRWGQIGSFVYIVALIIITGVTIAIAIVGLVFTGRLQDSVVGQRRDDIETRLDNAIQKVYDTCCVQDNECAWLADDVRAACTGSQDAFGEVFREWVDDNFLRLSIITIVVFVVEVSAPWCRGQHVFTCACYLVAPSHHQVLAVLYSTCLCCRQCRKGTKDHDRKKPEHEMQQQQNQRAAEAPVGAASSLV